MPELPEIAQTKRYLDAMVLEKQIKEVEFPGTKVLQASEEEFKKALINKRLKGTVQLGKYLFLETSGDLSLVFHFGMTGRFEVYRHGDHPKHSQMIILLEDSSRLGFVCPRKLGKIYLSKGIVAFQEEFSLGKDALNVKRSEFIDLLDGKRGGVKSALTDQHFISGIGNVYADEILYQSRIHPRTKIEKLTGEEKKHLFEQMNMVLKRAIENEGKRSELPADHLTPHRKEGADCPRCSGKIEMIKVSGRSTYFCPKCQKEKT